ncbi:MAG: MoaD/ThiS family protein [Cyanobacteria bacterium]|nr:MoaD/ThiS family protein [Cyanobacteria bacterium bin.51]
MPTRLVTVRLFAALRERAGWGERRVALPADQPRMSATDLWWQLELGDRAAGADGAQPGSLPSSLRVAINQAFASPDQPLQAGDELAFLPPISGG